MVAGQQTSRRPSRRPKGLCHRRRHRVACLLAINSLPGPRSGDSPGPVRKSWEAGHGRLTLQLPVARAQRAAWPIRGGPQEQRGGAGAGGRRSAQPTTSAGWRATTEPPARWPRSSARTTRSRASRSRRKRIGWLTGHGAGLVGSGWSATRSARRTPLSIARSSASSCAGEHRTVRSSPAPASGPGAATRFGVVGSQRDDERLRQRLDHLGLFGHLRTDRPLRGGEPRCQSRAFADVAQRRGACPR